jgi:hypothetical protein
MGKLLLKTEEKIMTEIFIPGQAFLAWKTIVHFTGRFQQHGIDQSYTKRDLSTLQNKIGHTAPAVLRGDLGTSDAQVAFTPGGSL